MRAAVMQGAGRPLAVRDDLPDPVPGAGELVLRVARCGVCGSDLHAAEAFDARGLVLGHEFCGEVVAVGTDGGDWRAGDRAAGFPLLGCGRCAACLAGAIRKCAAAEMIGFERPGAFAEYVTVGAREAQRLPDGIDDDLGALVEPLAVGLHAVERGRTEPAEPVLVLGGGPVGLAVALWARHLGAREVVVSDPVRERRRLAALLGATATVDPTVDDVGGAFADVAGHPPRAVVECVGVPGLVQHAVDIAGVDARVTIAGVCMAPDTFSPLTALMKELTLAFAIYYRAQDFATTIALLESGRIDPRPMVTDSVTLDALPERFEALKRPTDECKVLVRP